MVHDFYRVPRDLEAQLQACFDAAGLTAAQVRWLESPCQGFRRCQVLWITPAQHQHLDALVTMADQTTARPPSQESTICQTQLSPMPRP